MSLKRVQPFADRDTDGDQAADDLRGPWLNSRAAQRWVGCKTLKGWYAWRRRHHIVPRANGTVAKRDLDRELAKKRTHRMAAASLRNLRRQAS